MILATYSFEKKIRNDKSIVIKETDKGGMVAVMDAQYYCEKIIEMLSDNEFYQEIPSITDAKTMNFITNLAKKHRENFKDEEIKYLTDFVYCSSYFYGLPKRHKGELKLAMQVKNF